MRISVLFVVLGALSALLAPAAALHCSSDQAVCLQVVRGQAYQTCYSPSTHRCLTEERILVPLSQNARCGDGGVQSATQVCHPDGFVCPRRLPDLCGATCYDSNLYVCRDAQIYPRQ